MYLTISDKILVVDDDFDMLELIELNLTADGFEVISSGSGTEALAKVKQYKPDLNLLNLIMPRIDGYDVMNRLKADRMLSKYWILLTALVQIDDKIKDLNASADNYVTKLIENYPKKEIQQLCKQNRCMQLSCLSLFSFLF